MYGVAGEILTMRLRNQAFRTMIRQVRKIYAFMDFAS